MKRQKIADFWILRRVGQDREVPVSHKITATQQMFLASMARDMAHGDLKLAATLLLTVGVNVLRASGGITNEVTEAEVLRLTREVLKNW
jgi:hypothetical protein